MRFLLLALLLIGSIAGPAAASQRLFGFTEIGSATERQPPQWELVAKRLAMEVTTYPLCDADPSACANPGVQRWRAMLKELEGAPLEEQLERVNRFVNALTYTTDIELYGVSDYWATPAELFEGQGDCEDMAIAKYVSLRGLGVGPDRLRLVVLQDTARDLAHAVLAVRTDSGTVVLDNVHNRILPDEEFPHYAPYYSLNEAGRWLHVPPRSTDPRDDQTTPAGH